MQSYVPAFARETAALAAQEDVTINKDFVHISYANECQICFGTCLKPRRLSCEHEFCKTCLVSYFEKVDRKELKCPACKHPIDIPVEQVKRNWTNSFKVDKRTLFYTKAKEKEQCTPLKKSISFTDGAGAKTSDRQQDLTRSLSLSLKRKSPLLDDRDGYVTGFSSKTNSDRMSCTYWGSDALANGDIVLADWMNSKVKLFNKNGFLISDLPTKISPLDVAVMHDGLIVVSFGSKSNEVYFLIVHDNELTTSKIVPLNGHIYSISRCAQNCVGIYETDDNTIAFVDIKIRKGALKLYPLGVAKDRLSSSSGVVCINSTREIFCTDKKTIYCIGPDGSLKYEASFPRLQTGDEQLEATHSLGSLSCDMMGRVYVASNFCVLQLTADGRLINVFPTKIDPYTICVVPGNDIVVVAGRNNRAEILRLDHGVQALR